MHELVTKFSIHVNWSWFCFMLQHTVRSMEMLVQTCHTIIQKVKYWTPKSGFDPRVDLL